MKLLSLLVFGAALCSLRSAVNRALAQGATVAGPPRQKRHRRQQTTFHQMLEIGTTPTHHCAAVRISKIIKITKRLTMKTNIKNLFLLSALIAGLGLIPAGRVTAQTFTNLYNFTGFDGAEPHAGLILSGSTLYGTAQLGGSSGRGTVFAVNTNGAREYAFPVCNRVQNPPPAFNAIGVRRANSV
jgi:uncharacterized repeat protein (TIGR03803 family)